MAEFSIASLWFALLIILTSHFIGAIAAFGSSLLAVPPLLLLFGTESLEQIIFVLLVVGLLQSSLLAAQNWRSADLRMCARLLTGSALGIPIGMTCVGYLPERGIMILLGSLTLLVGSSSLLSNKGERTKPSSKWALPVTIVSGSMQGAFASGGTILVAYAQRALPDRDVFRATLSVYWTLLNIAFVTLLIFKVRPGVEEVSFATLAGLLVLVVTVFANRMTKRIRRDLFQRGVSILLILGGCLILTSQLTR